MLDRARHPPAKQILSSTGEDEHPIRCTQAGAQEVALYKTSVTIRNLKSLDLVSNVSGPTLYEENASINPDWDEFDNQCSEEDLGGINRSRNGRGANTLSLLAWD
jgi:hypothetical protein